MDPRQAGSSAPQVARRSTPEFGSTSHSESGRRDERDLELFARKVAIVFAFAILVAFLWFVRRIIVLLFIAGVLAAGIAPVVHRVRLVVRRYLKIRIRRGTAVVLVYLPFLVAAVLLITFMLPHVVADSRRLAEELPLLVEQKILRPLERYVPVGAVRGLVAGGGGNDLQVFGFVRGALGVVVSIVAILVLIIYMLIDADRLRNLFLLLFPARDRRKKQKMIRRMSRRMSSWLSGQLLLASIIGVATFIAFVSLGIPYALPLALIAAVGELIPIIGPIVGAIPALGVALLRSPWHFWAVLVVAIVIQQVENYVLVPRVLGKKVSISPLAVCTAFMIGASLLGIVGAIMAIPAAAIAQVAFEEVFVSRRERRQDATRPGTLMKTD